MENNNRTLIELATPDVLYKSSAQTPKGISRGMFHNEAVGDTRGLHQYEGVSFLPRWSNKGLAILTIGSVQHLG
ncbi:hypothetical protein CR513_42010, partial [Mucuna pruriens]